METKNKVINCIICGNKFEKKRKNSKCCCKACSYEYCKKSRSARLRLTKSTLDNTVNEIVRYNKIHGTNLSYGKYMALKERGLLEVQS